MTLTSRCILPYTAHCGQDLPIRQSTCPAVPAALQTDAPRVKNDRCDYGHGTSGYCQKSCLLGKAASTMTRRHASMPRRPNWPGSEPQPFSRRIWCSCLRRPAASLAKILQVHLQRGTGEFGAFHRDSQQARCISGVRMQCPCVLALADVAALLGNILIGQFLA